MSTISPFRSIENEHAVYRGKNCIKAFCEHLREHTVKINFLKMGKKMKLLTREQKESYENAEIYYICKTKMKIDMWKIKKKKVRDHCRYTQEYRGAAHSIYNLIYNVTKKTPIDFHKGSNYGYHFIIKVLVEKFLEKITCLGENTEKYITFTILIER